MASIRKVLQDVIGVKDVTDEQIRKLQSAMLEEIRQKDKLGVGGAAGSSSQAPSPYPSRSPTVLGGEKRKRLRRTKLQMVASARTKQMFRSLRGEGRSRHQLERRDSESSFSSDSVVVGKMVEKERQRELKRRRMKRESEQEARKALPPIGGIESVEEGNLGEFVRSAVLGLIGGGRPAVDIYAITLNSLQKFFEQNTWPNATSNKRAVIEFIRRNLLQLTQDIKDTYVFNSNDDPDSTARAVTVFQLQILLELATIGDDTVIQEKTLEEVVSKRSALRILEMRRRPKSEEAEVALEQFFEAAVVGEFVESIPQNLACLYDFLFKKLPPELEDMERIDQPAAESSPQNTDVKFRPTSASSPKLTPRVRDTSPPKSAQSLSPASSAKNKKNPRKSTTAEGGAKRKLIAEDCCKSLDRESGSRASKKRQASASPLSKQGEGGKAEPPPVRRLVAAGPTRESPRQHASTRALKNSKRARDGEGGRWISSTSINSSSSPQRKRGKLGSPKLKLTKKNSQEYYMQEFLRDSPEPEPEPEPPSRDSSPSPSPLPASSSSQSCGDLAFKGFSLPDHAVTAYKSGVKSVRTEKYRKKVDPSEVFYSREAPRRNIFLAPSEPVRRESPRKKDSPASTPDAKNRTGRKVRIREDVAYAANYYLSVRNEDPFSPVFPKRLISKIQSPNRLKKMLRRPSRSRRQSLKKAVSRSKQRAESTESRSSAGRKAAAPGSVPPPRQGEDVSEDVGSLDIQEPLSVETSSSESSKEERERRVVPKADLDSPSVEKRIACFILSPRNTRGSLPNGRWLNGAKIGALAGEKLVGAGSREPSPASRKPLPTRQRANSVSDPYFKRRCSPRNLEKPPTLEEGLKREPNLLNGELCYDLNRGDDPWPKGFLS